MVDFVALVTPPKLVGPDMKPANGDIYVRSTNNIAKSGVIVVPFQVHGIVQDGEFKDLKGGPLMLVVTPDGVALEIFVDLFQDGPSGRRDKYSITRTVFTPNQTTVTWDALVDVVDPAEGPSYVIPTWAQELDAKADEAIAASDVAVFAASDAQSARDAAVAAKDAAQAVGDTNDAIMASVAADPNTAFGAQQKATFGRKFQANVIDYGAVGDWNGTTGTDNLAAFNAAKADVAVGGRIFVPPGRYYFSDTFVIDKCVDFTCGRGGFGSNEPGTQLVFAAGKTGIWGKKNSFGIRPSGARVGPFEILSRSTAAGSDIGVLWTDGQVYMDYVSTANFGSHGVALLAGVNSPYTTGNVNNSLLFRVRAYGCRGDGIRIQGNDAQANILIKPDVVANYGWGINLDRTAQNKVDSPHADQTVNAPPGAFRENGNGNKWVQVYSESSIGFTIDTNSSFASISTTQYGRPALTDLSVAKSARIVDAEYGFSRSMNIRGDNATSAVYSGTVFKIDVDVAGAGLARVSLGANTRLDFTNSSGNRSYQNWNPATDGTLDMGMAAARWRNGLFSGFVRVGAVATGSRPTAAAAGAGGHMFDTTLGKPIWSNGTAWVDALGAAV